MDIVTKLIQHLLRTDHSIDTVDSIVNQLNVTRDDLLQLLNDSQCADYFQLLNPLNHRKQAIEKIALTLDLFCCTHYANVCKNSSCPFLHLCPYNVRPMHKKCTNKNCQFEHDVLSSLHNRRIIDSRQLPPIPAVTLLEIVRASADPARSFWVCTDNGKKNGCIKKQNCDKLHYCYYDLTDTCTKPHCQHIINDECTTYFRRKQLNDQEHNDILNGFRKVLRQRKSEHIHTNNGTRHSASSASASPKTTNSKDRQRKPSTNQQHCNSSSSRRTTSTIYDAALEPKADTAPPLPDDDQDIILFDGYDKDEHRLNESFLFEEIRCPIKLITTKQITSVNKTNQSLNASIKPTYYYYPMENPADFIQILRCQNEENPLVKSLIVYASILDAHDAAKQNFDNDQFCLLRVHVFDSGLINGTLQQQNRLQLNDPSTMCFDRMWIYTYDFH